MDYILFRVFEPAFYKLAEDSVARRSSSAVVILKGIAPVHVLSDQAHKKARLRVKRAFSQNDALNNILTSLWPIAPDTATEAVVPPPKAKGMFRSLHLCSDFACNIKDNF